MILTRPLAKLVFVRKTTVIYDECTIGTSGKISRSRFIPIMAFLLLALTGCAAPLSPDLEESLSVVVPTKVDFADLEYYAKRSKAAYDPVSDIRKAFPLATRIVTVKSVGVQYFVETDLGSVAKFRISVALPGV
ncbi:hypothetical protein [Sedimentitalea sp.]|uniref:hypothetical protein n=1 Tax=Sedimentitalea sp. TaxID=2048915 RepID=UPI003299D6A4